MGWFGDLMTWFGLEDAGSMPAHVELRVSDDVRMCGLGFRV